MDKLTETGKPRLTLGGFLTALLRSGISTLIVSLVAILAYGFRKGFETLGDSKTFLLQNRALLLGVFILLLAWNCWKIASANPPAQR